MNYMKIFHYKFSKTNNKGTSINTAKGKTNYMYISSRKIEFDVYMEDIKLHQINSYNHLDVVLDDGNNQETELTARIEKYTRNLE